MLEPRKLGLQPGIRGMLDLPALVGSSAHLFPRASVADMRQRPIANRAARMIKSKRCQAFSGGTLPCIVLVVVLETRYAQLFGSTMRVECYPLQTQSGEE